MRTARRGADLAACLGQRRDRGGDFGGEQHGPCAAADAFARARWCGREAQPHAQRPRGGARRDARAGRCGSRAGRAGLSRPRVGARRARAHTAAQRRDAGRPHPLPQADGHSRGAVRVRVRTATVHSRHPNPNPNPNSNLARPRWPSTTTGTTCSRSRRSLAGS